MPTDASRLPRAAYIHVPFCARRCGYCSFTLIAGRDELVERYLAALACELSWLERPRPVETLFIGGGTPTHLPPAALARLLTLVRQWFTLSEGFEFSVEANPAGLDEARLAVLAEFGVTRISLGAQSFDADKLRRLERDHQPADVARSFALARRWLPSVSLDLIFAAPDETLSVWQNDLAAALRLRPEHVSTYGLTYERGTTFWGKMLAGRLARTDEETERVMYAAAIDTLSAADYEHYEVSNFARPGRRCRHNEVYWAGDEYFAAGPGAARYVAGRREVNHRSTTTWLKRILAGRSPVAESEMLSPEERAREALVLGLRRLRGVGRKSFAGRTGFEIDDLVGPALRRYVELGLLVDDQDRVRLSRTGLFVSDALWPAFLKKDA
ncbi:MAG TPA: radical SAM family heme chaperone HemW [Pirellulales bacterium]|jgi:oxygen-independent coproporphyrinogen-3 oxidase|nr:radical SAM family heme chaperone HemW [Pirellulales bacterium]